MKKWVIVFSISVMMLFAGAVVIFADSNAGMNSDDLHIGIQHEQNAIIRYTRQMNEYEDGMNNADTQALRDDYQKSYNLAKSFRQDSLDLIAKYLKELDAQTTP